MGKLEFMEELRSQLSDFNEEKRNEILGNYERLFRIGKQQGKNELMLIQEFGKPEDIAAQHRNSDNRNADQWDIENSMKQSGKRAKRHKRRGRRGLIGIPIAILILAFGSAGVHRGFDFRNLAFHRYSINDTKTSSIDGLQQISVDSSEANLTFYKTANKELKAEVSGTFRGMGNYKPKLECYRSGDTLHVELAGENHGTILSLNSSVKMKVYIPENYANSLKINSSEGNVSVSDFKLKELNCEIEEGNISIGNITADDIITNTSEGNITAEDITTKSASMVSSEGNINISGITGDLKTSNDEGNTTIRYSKFDNNVDISSSEGSVRLELPSDSEFNLEADTDEGRIHYDFPKEISGTKSEEKIDGTVGNSSNKIKINNDEGNVTISQ